MAKRDSLEGFYFHFTEIMHGVSKSWDEAVNIIMLLSMASQVQRMLYLSQ